MSEEDLPKDWIKKESKSRKGKFFYYNTKTNTSTWDKPTDENETSNDKKKKKKREDKEEKRDNKKREEEIRASHILIKHNKSRNPTSHKESNITRDESAAKEILEEIIKQIKEEEYTFEELAIEKSDCSSFKKKGDLGFFVKSKMQKAFSDAAFKLAIGEMSGIVSTDSGVHIILRTG
eukprot:TRINITY_DN16702_c0_g1_i1.p1 TRINITY_DN16702_c0_g1~~TRINITY_DN16702_c0_g1_i1.p1  ORF type:complete len:178 (-),score=49.56 TRINITY_DN16702_c0_g1_i1:95-628(-)